jgi:hypothetical protein
MATERLLDAEKVEGEISLVIDYVPGRNLAVDVLKGAMELIESLDHLDAVLLSSVDTSLEPVSILNDVRHSSLKMMLARALRKLPDNHLATLEWRKWAGEILVKGKYLLLQALESDTPALHRVMTALEPDYKRAPAGLIGYSSPSIVDVQGALDKVAKARANFPGQKVTIQTELGDVDLPDTVTMVADALLGVAESSVTNKGSEFFKVKAPDYLGNSQWTVLRNGRQVRVDMVHQGWLDSYHERKIILLPGDSLECRYEETVKYDANHNEVDRRLAIIEVLRVISPPVQPPLSGLARN